MNQDILYIYNVENPKQIEIIGYITRNEKSIDFYEVQGAEYKLYGENYLGNGQMHPHLRDSAPDYWGRSVINKLMEMGYVAQNKDENTIDFEYLKYSNYDRIGNLFFYEDDDINSVYEQIEKEKHNIEDVITVINSFNQFEIAQMSDFSITNFTLQQAFLHGTSIGGARPKALVQYNQESYIAKFGSTSDIYPIEKMEYFAMLMAKSVGINTSDVLLMEDVVINNKEKDILLVKRFDRELVNGINYRKPLVSGLTVIQGSEFTSRYLGYMDLVEKSNIQANERKELYKRLLFNILVGNTDDHAKNHCFFWNSGNRELKMTPVYDVSPLPRKTNLVSQSMKITRESSLSILDNCLQKEVLDSFGIKLEEAIYLIKEMIQTITAKYEPLCEKINLNKDLLKNTIINESVFYPLNGMGTNLKDKYGFGQALNCQNTKTYNNKKVKYKP